MEFRSHTTLSPSGMERLMACFQTDNLHITQNPDGVATLVLDVAERSMNVFTRQVLFDLDAALDRIAGERGLRLLVIRSGKPTGFIAGADLQEFTRVTGPSDAEELSLAGQRLFDKLADLRIPTVAIISGPCLGGGLEFALACDYRVVIDHPKTQLGLPEIEIGLLPGWGGTQRLPRVVGLERALRIILGGKRLKAGEALAWGLADRVQPAAGDDTTPITDGVKRPRHGLPLRTWRQRLLESTPLGRWLIFRGAERLVRRRTPDDFPAPLEALQAVRVGLKEGLAAGLACERAAIGRLASTPASRNLIQLFFQREQARKVPAKYQASQEPPIRQVGIVGAGTMGAGIAQLAALKGCEVVIREVNETALAAGVLRIFALFNKAVERGVLTAEESQRRLNSIHGTTAWKGFSDVDLVVEAVIEDLQAKRAVFREMEKEAPPSAILATNTSSLSVRQLQEVLKHPGRVAGLHFFNPVHKMPLVEVVQAPATTDETVAALVRWAIQLGKTPIVVRDSPGFVVNRVLMPYLNEAVLLAREGMSIARIDQAMRRFGMPMGPLELIDQVGLDVAAHIARSMEPLFGDRFPPPDAFQRMQDRGWLGQKSGIGFYRYQGKKKRVNEGAVAILHEKSLAPAGSRREVRSAGEHTDRARERMVYLMVNEAAACLGEGLAENASAIDLAMVLGTGWAPHRGGPLQYGRDYGYDRIVSRMQELAQDLGARFEPCAELRRLATQGQPQLQG
jgi:3-hydroxyacyl-CoA dehydrogenase/enoyl-CoA hydratase/3-hydroxybutyryl-CoA epimerase